MTKEDVDYNIRFLPYFRALIQAAKDIPEIRKDQSLSAEERRIKVAQVRQDLDGIWEKLNG